MKNIVILIMGFLILSCNSEECEENKEFHLMFKEQISILEHSVKNQDGLFSHGAIRSLFYFKELTGINPTVVLGDLSYYESTSDYRSDKRKWMKWYKENKCIVNIVRSEEIMNKVIKDTYWMDQ